MGLCRGNTGNMDRWCYPTDLTDGQWQWIEPLLPSARHYGRHRKHEMREIIDAIFYVLRSGCAWRMLPHDFPPWQTVYYYFRRWTREGVFGGINEALRKEVRAKAGRDEQPRAGILDSQSVKTTEKGGYAATMQPSTSRAGSATS